MITAKTFRILSDLMRNNDRAWFQAHKDRYLEAKAGFQGAVEELIDRIAVFDPSVKGLEAGPTIPRRNGSRPSGEPSTGTAEN
jgi:uncharacterized protein (DUF2461 family)